MKISKSAIVLVVAAALVGVGLVSAPANAATGGSGPTYAWCTTHPSSTPKWVDRSHKETYQVHGNKNDSVTVTCYLQPQGSPVRSGEIIYYGPQV